MDCQKSYCSRCSTQQDLQPWLCHTCQRFRGILFERAELMKLKVKDLRDYLHLHGVSTQMCREKEELVELVLGQHTPTSDTHIPPPPVTTHESLNTPVITVSPLADNGTAELGPQTQATEDGQVKNVLSFFLFFFERSYIYLMNEYNAGSGTAVEESLCKICMDSPIDCVLLDTPVYQCTCFTPFGMNECPICRQYVVRAVHVFRS
uniref:RING-type E3 ubiquitin transferase n=1 Tax=Sinocyclocheilus grahami TaxID=75366 RepID=A0A672K1M2_SINGR